MDQNPSLDKLYTSDHVLECKWSAVSTGYIDDEFINYFCNAASRGPLLNMLHFLRIKAVRWAVSEFFNRFHDEKSQLVNLGCGMDTLAFWILKRHKHVKCYEIDILSQLERKAALMRSSGLIMALIGAEEVSCSSVIVTNNYKMIPADFNNIEDIHQLFTECGISNEKPTLFLSECSLAYLDVDSSNKIIGLASKASCCPSLFVFFEQGKADDKFGQMLMDRFQEFGIENIASSFYPTPESQVKRYRDLGWDQVAIMDMNQFYNSCIKEEEKKRIKTLEWLDEVEELVMVCSHFIIGVCATHPAAFADLFCQFDRQQLAGTPKGYTTEEVLRMIKDGTTSLMKSASLKDT